MGFRKFKNKQKATKLTLKDIEEDQGYFKVCDTALQYKRTKEEILQNILMELTLHKNISF